MLINGLGQYFGMISGGCLEADIVHKSRQTMDDGQPRLLTYDMSEDSEMAWRFGLGCGGTIEVLLQSANQDNHYLNFEKSLKQLEAGETVHYFQKLGGATSECHLLKLDSVAQRDYVAKRTKSTIAHQHLIEQHGLSDSTCDSRLGGIGSSDIASSDIASSKDKDDSWFINRFEPQTRLVIFGGGVDARPLVNMAHELSWHITLCDPRETYARQKNFPRADDIVKTAHDNIDTQAQWLHQADAIVIMNHNVTLDAKSLRIAQASRAKYVGMLGPFHRTERVLKEAGLPFTQLKKLLANPIGLDLGGDQPETIALSIVSEIQAYLHSKSAHSLSLNLANTQMEHALG